MNVGQAAVDAVVAEVKALGAHASGASIDVTDAEAFPAWVGDAIGALGGCDIFISFVSCNPVVCPHRVVRLVC